MGRIVLVGMTGVVVALAIGWLIVTRTMSRERAAEQAAATATPVAATAPTEAEARKIRATLFYIAEDGMRLVATEREVAFGPDPVTQARRLVEAELEPAPPPLATPLPAGTTVRGLFVTEGGDAFVDLSKDAASNHTGGSLDELFSVYAIVNVLTVNLPAINRVQILVDGKEVDTLAGHVDLRTPLQKSYRWVAPPVATP
jgi:spore germination protein GerM